MSFVLSAFCFLLWYHVQAGNTTKPVKSDKPAESENPIDYKALLEKYSKAYSAMDKKALSGMVSLAYLKTLKGEFAKFKRAKEKPELILVWQYQHPLKNKQIVIDALMSMQINGKSVYFNGPAQFVFKGGKLLKINKLFRPGYIGYFWDAVKASKEIGVLEAKGRGKELKVVELLPNKKFDEHVRFPRWIIHQVRTDGKYLLPLHKGADGNTVTGAYYTIPSVKEADETKYAELFEQYRQLKPQDENKFLKQVMLDEKFSSLRYPGMRRLAETREFNYPLSSKEMDFLKDVFSRKSTSIVLKRNLLYQLSRSNFLPDNPVFIEAMKDPKLASMAGRIFSRRDKAKFRKMMIKWLNDKDPKLRDAALHNSTLMGADEAYVNTAMKHLNIKKLRNANIKDLRYYIPVLCASKNKRGKEIIRNFLQNDEDPKNYSIHYAVILEISKRTPEIYVDAIKSFLKHHKNNRLVQNGIIYPLSLYCLCKAHDPDGFKLALAYLDTLKPDSKDKVEMVRYSTFRNVFYRYNPRLNNINEYRSDFTAKLKKIKNKKKPKSSKISRRGR